MLTECLEAGMNTRELDSRANYLRGHRCSEGIRDDFLEEVVPWGNKG